MACCAERESCGDSCDKFCPCISMYPNLCTAFLCLITSAIFITVFSAYAFISLRTSIFRFDWPLVWFAIVNSSFVALATVIPIIVLSISLWCLCSTRRRAVAFKVFFVLLLLATILVLAACIIAAVLIIYGAREPDSFFARELEGVWMAEIAANSTLGCRVQRQLSCRGFEPGDCQRDSPSANFSRCATRCREEDLAGRPDFDHVLYPGCRAQMSSFYLKWNAVFLSGAIASSLFAVVALLVSCSFSFILEK